MAHRSRTLRVCAGCLCAIACLLLLKAQDSFAQRPVAQLYMSSASGVDLVQHQVTLPAYIGSTSDGATVYYIVTEASTPAAARLWGVNAAPSLSGLRGSSQVQRVRQQATPDNSDVVFNATVDFEYGRRRVVPGPAGKEFPPMAFNYSAMADPGYSSYIQLPDGTILNAPHVANSQPGSPGMSTAPKVKALVNGSVTLDLTPGFANGRRIVYISTDASDPLAATLENVPYVPSLAKVPDSTLIDLVAFTNGQTGATNPQRQGLTSAIADGQAPLNIAANAPDSPAYSPLWAVNLAKWVGSPPGPAQTSVSAVQGLSTAGQVASFNPMDASSNAPLARSGIVVSCPIVADVGPALEENFIISASAVDLEKLLVTLPVYKGVTRGSKETVHYIVTDASTPEAAVAWGVNYAPALARARDTPQVQQVRSGANSSGPISPANSSLVFAATVDFDHGKRAVTPGPSGSEFPPSAFNYSAEGQPGYSPLIQLPDGTILNAPHIANSQPGSPGMSTAPKVKALVNGSVTLDLTPGFANGRRIVYISTDASDPLAATLENVPYVPSLANVSASTLIDLVAFTNGQTGATNPQRQGLTSAIADGQAPLNIAANAPDSPAYSPLWAVNLAKWVTSPPGSAQTSVSAVQGLSTAGQVASFNPMDPASNAPLARSGIVVNCPIIAAVGPATRADSGAGTMSTPGGCEMSGLGYQCMYTDPTSGVVIHHSKGGALPRNGCTMGVGSPPDNAGQLLHFAIEGPASQGWLAMSFPQQAGRMYPAMAVLGAKDPATGNPKVTAYSITRYNIGPEDATQDFAVSQGYQSIADKALVCFSVPASKVYASGTRRKLVQTDNQAVNINWALNPSTAGLVMHTQKGSLSLVPGGGASTAPEVDDSKLNRLRIAHGILMTLAFVLCFPSGALMARHKWLVGAGQDGKVRPAWFHAHRILQMVGLACGVAGFILIWASFGWAGRADTTTLYTPHRALGITVIAMVMVQAATGIIRPGFGAKSRPVWRRVHQGWGWASTLLGVATALIGILLIAQLSGVALLSWLVPVVVFLGLLLLAGAIAEVFKIRLTRKGCYAPLTHHLSAPGALPMMSGPKDPAVYSPDPGADTPAAGRV